MELSIEVMQKRIETLKLDLCAAKSELDNIPHVGLITSFLDPFKEEKYKISRKTKQKYISNAWLKCFSILTRFNLYNKSYIRHFDNAAFPGAFILATKYVITQYNATCNYNWRACSLYDINQSHLNDDYKLYKQFPNNWLMDSRNNGDITKLENINDIASKLVDKTTLYTSDLGFDVSHSYNDQEKLHFQANTGQVLLCLKVLQEGGNCVIKHYTYFEDYTIKYLNEFSKLFGKFHFYKPSTSKALNSEIYLVGLNFAKSRNFQMYTRLVYNLEYCLNYNLYALTYQFPLDFMESIWEMTKNVVNRQIIELKKIKAIRGDLQKITSSRYNCSIVDISDRSFLFELIGYAARKYRQFPLVEYNSEGILVKLGIKYVG